MKPVWRSCRKKEELEGYNIDNEVIKYIATNVKSNIRELEGALTKIVALSKLNNKEITTELAEEALKDLISPNAEKEVTPELIIQVVADHFGITPLDISSQKRNKEIVYPAPDRDVYLPFDARNFPAEYRQIFRRSGSHDDHPRSRQDRCRYGEKRIASQHRWKS